MKKNIEIKSMLKEHLEYIVKIEDTCFSEPWTYKGFYSELLNRNSYFIVALIENKVAAYAGMHCILGDCYITNIAVEPTYRNLGIGKSLINNLINYATQKKYNFISLEVRESNKIAKKLYENFQFKESGIRKNFYKKPNENAVIMTYTL